MQVHTRKGSILSSVACTLAFALGFPAAHAQTTATGQVLAPGTTGSRTTTNCAPQDPNSASATANVQNCVDAPGFATPSTNVPVADRGHPVTSLVRVDAVVPRPPVALPAGDTFSVVGNVTLVKLSRPALEACLASGRRISARASARTSTTCLDAKGDVLAYQECRANSTEAEGCTVLTPQEIARQQVTAKAR